MEVELPLKRDVRGNRENLRYGSLEKSTVPRYRLSGSGRVIGLSRDYRIQRSGNAERIIASTGTDFGHPHKREYLTSNVARTHSISVRPGVEVDDSIQAQSNYISFGTPVKRSKLSGLEERPFSIIQNRISGDEDAGSSGESDGVAGETNAWDAFRNDVAQKRHRELLKQTSDDPQNLEAWLNLVQHQEALLRSTGGGDDIKMTAAQRQTLVAMRISIYEQALAKVSQPGAHQHLVSGLMKEGSKIWNREKQLSEWQRLLDGNASNELRLLHLDFLMSSTHLFTYERVLDIATTYLHLSSHGLQSDARNHQTIALLLRITMFMRQAGYTERALAIWQAHLELTISRPSVSSHERTRLFEEFWDSECPRVGEPGAMGWAKSVMSQVSARTGPEQNISDGPGSQSSSWLSWVSAERSTQDHCLLPSRTVDATNDPFRAVLFSDIERFLNFEIVNDFKYEVLYGFLRFCGLSEQLSRGTTEAIDTDPFLYAFDVRQNDDLRSTIVTASTPVDPLSLFEVSSSLFATFSGTRSGSPYIQLALRALKQLLTEQPDNDALAVYTVALELSENPTGARKLAKKFLKQRGDSVRLYNAYALVEERLNGLAVAEKVWLAVLSQQGNTADDYIYDHLMLLRTWAWRCTAAGQTVRALQVIAAARNPPPLFNQQRPVEQLAEAETFLWSHLSRAHSQSKLNQITTIVDLLAISRYNSTNRSLTTALEIFERCLSLSTFSQPPTQMPQEVFITLEQLHTNRNRLIDHHTASSSVEFRPSQITALLQSSCHAFPDNFTFRKHLNAFSQKHGGIDRLRTAAASARTTNPALVNRSLTDHISAINAALSLPLHQGGTQHVIRAAFQQALHPDSPDATSSTSIRSCPDLNLAFMRWELDLLHRVSDRIQAPSKRDSKPRNRQVQNVKAAFQTAVTNCPWVKEVYLTYFDEALVGGVEEREWAEVYDSMLERGLRVCVEY